MIGKIFKKWFPQNSFVGNLAVSIFGSGSSYLIGFLITPIITRIYAPEVYGTFALINSIAINFTVIATLNFMPAFMIPVGSEKYASLVRLTFAVTSLSCAIFFVTTFFFEDLILEFFNAEVIKGWLFLVPLLVMMNFFNRVVQFWNLRNKKFKVDAIAKNVSVVSSKLATLIYGISLSGVVQGLILGEIIFKSSNTLYHLSANRIAVFSTFLKGFSYEKLRNTFIEYKNYPKYMLPADWLALAVTQIPIFALSSIYNSETTGYYALTNSLLTVPLQIVGMSSATVFYQKAIEIRENPELLKVKTFEFFKKLFWAGILPFGVLSIYGDILFSFFFGDDWIVSGQYARSLGFYYLILIVSYPISSLYRVLKKEKLFLTINAINVGITTSLLYSLKNLDAEIYLLIYAIISSLILLISDFLILKVTRARTLEILGMFTKLILVTALTFGLLYMLRKAVILL